METEPLPGSSNTLSLTIEERLVPTEEGKSAYSVVTKLMVNGVQIGAVSELHINAASDQLLPEVQVDFLKGMDPRMAARLSDDLKARMKLSIDLLRQFSFVKVTAPTELVEPDRNA